MQLKEIAFFEAYKAGSPLRQKEVEFQLLLSCYFVILDFPALRLGEKIKYKIEKKNVHFYVKTWNSLFYSSLLTAWPILQIQYIVLRKKKHLPHRNKFHVFSIVSCRKFGRATRIEDEEETTVKEDGSSGVETESPGATRKTIDKASRLIHRDRMPRILLRRISTLTYPQISDSHIKPGTRLENTFTDTEESSIPAIQSEWEPKLKKRWGIINV